jgi:predicted GTPase
LRESLVIGRPNVGKTLFTVNFAEFLGQRRLEVMFRPRDGAAYTRIYTIPQARAELVDDTPHRTLILQSIIIKVPKGKSLRKVVLTDSTGLTDDVHPSSAVRRAMADTIRGVTGALVILHLIDPVVGITGIDLDIARYGKTVEGYVVLANKMDLPGRAERLADIARLVAPAPVLGISALRKTGFGEVRAFVRRHF